MLSLAALAAVFVACASPADESDQTSDDTAAVTGAGHRVCSWNMRRLGNPFTGKPKDMTVAAQVIKDNCDVLAIEETMATNTAVSTTAAASDAGAPESDHQGYDDLLTALGTRYWGGLITPTAAPLNPETSNSEYYGFVYRKSAAAPCSGWTEAKRLPDPQDIFLREPGWGCFKLKARDKELLLAGYHAIFGEPAQRTREVGFLQADLNHDGKKDDVFTTIQASRPGADLIFAGDFNQTNGEIASELTDYKDLTNGNGSTLNYNNDLSTNEYDHMLVLPSSDLATNAPAVPLDVRKDYHGSFYDFVSDHIPIQIILK